MMGPVGPLSRRSDRLRSDLATVVPRFLNTGKDLSMIYPLVPVLLLTGVVVALGMIYLLSADHDRRQRAWRLLRLLLGCPGARHGHRSGVGRRGR